MTMEKNYQLRQKQLQMEHLLLMLHQNIPTLAKIFFKKLLYTKQDILFLEQSHILRILNLQEIKIQNLYQNMLQKILMKILPSPLLLGLD